MKKAGTKVKIVIDTNIWISFIIGKTLKGLQYHINSEHITIYTCNEQYNELINVLSRPAIKKHLSNKVITDFIELFEESTQNIEIISQVNICRDPKDNYLIALCIDSLADYLITGDKDLLDIKDARISQIITYRMFEEILSTMQIR